MWWKLTCLVVITAVLTFMVIPIHTHATGYDPASQPAPRSPSPIDLISNMYPTPGTALLVLSILGIAGLIGFKVIRGQW